MPNYGSKLEKVPVFSGLHRINHAIGHTAQERGGCSTYLLNKESSGHGVIPLSAGEELGF